MLEVLADLPPVPRVFVVLFAVFCFAAVPFWLAAAIYMLRIPFNAKPDSIQGWLRLNPLNLMFYGDRLTPKGLLLRKRMMISAGGFFASLALGSVCYWIAMALN
ncbi:hypothetical protein [Pelagibius marinus]|uniref:hypothetical protein n=1 Tax=Pelagibius marinus TaxID=2762760 RepID=UPI00187284AF|nr:hypothetical protein [Pelagibius marinus]